MFTTFKGEEKLSKGLDQDKGTVDFVFPLRYKKTNLNYVFKFKKYIENILLLILI